MTLKDREAACAELSPRDDQLFEVGVFCGQYVTPVSQGYLEKVEKTRGKQKGGDGQLNRASMTVGDSMTTRPTVFERPDISLDNLIGDQ